ncbi:MAG: hypothetical protein COU69_00755 [Candidatus Pacebacteria bacterium CG10_big_fil_rev_8_21_14_0_10_56_10]|nr:MAG: hypothetical protein COU69_00755 [Candidatus Pacebacteria bacterium CG10_big_fil_rev_8_21_14_0_10_56_10]
MVPTLLRLGPVAFQTLNVMVTFAFLAGAFMFWRKGREEHYDEVEIFDGFLLSTLFGLVVGRWAFVMLNFEQFGLDVIGWLDVVARPGLSILAMLVSSALYLTKYARTKKWDAFEVLDFWALAVSFSLIFVWIGLFAAGQVAGTPTQLPWAVPLPGLDQRVHPVPLYFVLFYFGLYGYLLWAECRYRTFGWYRSRRSTAQTGFLLSVFLLGTGLFVTVTSFVTQPLWQLADASGQLVGGLVLAGLGGLMLYVRSGRKLPLVTSRRRPPPAPSFEIQP